MCRQSDPWNDFVVSLPALLSPAELLQRALRYRLRQTCATLSSCTPFSSVSTLTCHSAVQAGFGRIPPPMVVEDTAAAQAQREATLRSLAHQLDIRLRKARLRTHHTCTRIRTHTTQALYTGIVTL